MANAPVAQHHRDGIADALAHTAILEGLDKTQAMEVAISSFIGSALYIEAHYGRPRLLQLFGELSRTY
jgi:pyrroline-5-carboxylate reductase